MSCLKILVILRSISESSQVSSSGEACLFFPSRLWSPRSVAETQIEGIVCCDSCLKTRQSQMVQKKKGALQEADSLLYVTGFASCLFLS